MYVNSSTQSTVAVDWWWFSRFYDCYTAGDGGHPCAFDWKNASLINAPPMCHLHTGVICTRNQWWRLPHVDAPMYWYCQVYIEVSMCAPPSSRCQNAITAPPLTYCHVWYVNGLLSIIGWCWTLATKCWAKFQDYYQCMTSSKFNNWFN